MQKIFRSFCSHQPRYRFLLLVVSLLTTPEILTHMAYAVGNSDSILLSIPENSALLFPAMKLPISTWVGPGDVLKIKVFPDTSSYISGDYTILEGGCVVFPILGLVQVTSHSMEELTEHLTESYSRYFSFPSVIIEPLITLSFLGGFLHPGMHLVNPLKPLSRALSTAGGTVRDDGLKHLRWERDGKVIEKDLISKIQGSTSLWSLGFRSGDQICTTQEPRRDMFLIANFIISTLLSISTIILTIQAIR